MEFSQDGVTPLRRSVLLRKSSTVVNSSIEIITRMVAADKMVGLISWRIPDHICRGRVNCSGPPTNSTITTSSKEVMKAKRAPEITPGKISGISTLKKLRIGPPPRLAAALVKL